MSSPHYAELQVTSHFSFLRGASSCEELFATAAVLGISPDKPEKLAKFRERDSLTITLLSDPDKQVMQAWGAFGEKKLYGKVVEGVIRSTLLVDEEGKVELAQYNVKATGHVAKLRKDLGLAT